MCKKHNQLWSSSALLFLFIQTFGGWCRIFQSKLLMSEWIRLWCDLVYGNYSFTVDCGKLFQFKIIFIADLKNIKGAHILVSDCSSLQLNIFCLMKMFITICLIISNLAQEIRLLISVLGSFSLLTPFIQDGFFDSWFAAYIFFPRSWWCIVT